MEYETIKIGTIIKIEYYKEDKPYYTQVVSKDNTLDFIFVKEPMTTKDLIDRIEKYIELNNTRSQMGSNYTKLLNVTYIHP